MKQSKQIQRKNIPKKGNQKLKKKTTQKTVSSRKVPYGMQSYTKKTQKKIKKRKQIKIRYGRVLVALVCFAFLLFLFSKFLELPIRNIYIAGNVHISDQEIIELAGIQNYPSIIKTRASDLEKRLQKDSRIVSAKIKKRKWKELHIEIVENNSLFYNQTTNKTILSDFREIEEFWDAPVLLNYVPDTIYGIFKEKMKKIDVEILNRISEIMYQPSNVDEERFLFTMRDGNYVYLTLETFENINNYVSIYAEFTSKYGNRKGILNLDSGQYFTILE